jgi:hypothetical protein
MGIEEGKAKESDTIWDGEMPISSAEILDALLPKELAFVINNFQVRNKRAGKIFSDSEAIKHIVENPSDLTNALCVPNYPSENMKKRLLAFNKGLSAGLWRQTEEL